MDRGPIKDDFYKQLNIAYKKIVYSDVSFLQLRTVDLPDKFEDTIQLSEVKRQDIQKAYAEFNKVEVEVDTRIKSANFQADVIIVTFI